MKLIGWKERQRRMREVEGQAWDRAGHDPDDPGLRNRYASIPRAPVRLIACPLVKDVNHGGLLRVADAFRIERVEFSPEEDGAVDFSGNRGTLSYQPYRWLSVKQAIFEAKTDGYPVVALTLSPRSVALEQFQWTFPLAIVVGAENEGVPAEIEELCDASVAIPLYGMITSLNVVTAASIVLHEAVRKYALQAEFLPVRQASAKLIT